MAEYSHHCVPRSMPDFSIAPCACTVDPEAYARRLWAYGWQWTHVLTADELTVLFDLLERKDRLIRDRATPFLDAVGAQVEFSVRMEETPLLLRKIAQGLMGQGFTAVTLLDALDPSRPRPQEPDYADLARQWHERYPDGRSWP